MPKARQVGQAVHVIDEGLVLLAAWAELFLLLVLLAYFLLRRRV
jgi:hypothetical protein